MRVRRGGAGVALLAVLGLAACGGSPSPSAASSSLPSLPSSNSSASSPASATASALVSSKVSPPVAGAVFDYQIGGAYKPAASVQVVDRDRAEKPVAGLYNICYVNALQTQSDEPGQSTAHPPYGVTAWWRKHHPSLLVHKSGHIVVDKDWNEAILDVSTAHKRAALLTIQKPWVKACATKGFQAVEPDNQDSYDRSHKVFRFSADKAYLTSFTRYAHLVGLAVAQKNTSDEFGTTGKKDVGFDFAIAEECGYYHECGAYTKVFGGHVIEIEYTDEARSAFTASCAARGAKISIIRRDRDVVPRGAKGYSYSLCP